MRRSVSLAALVGACLLLPLVPTPAPAQGVPEKYRPTVKKGLEFLAKQQHRDGRWEADRGRSPVSMTALCGLALLMEGSTPSKGRYKENLRRATEWFLAQSQKNGLVTTKAEAPSYLFGHGYAMLFLSSVYAVEEDRGRRKKLEDVLTRAGKYALDARTKQGGWGYVHAKDGGGFDEGAVTVVMLHGLRAARLAGIAVPEVALKDGAAYLKAATNPDGGVRYSLPVKNAGRPALTAGAIAGTTSPQDYKGPLVKKWLRFCLPSAALALKDLAAKARVLKVIRKGEPNIPEWDEFGHLYHAPVIYALGDDGQGKLFPETKPADRVTWSGYRQVVFELLRNRQFVDGSWRGTVGPVYTTAAALIVLQLDNAAVPIYQR